MKILIAFLLVFCASNLRAQDRLPTTIDHPDRRVWDAWDDSPALPAGHRNGAARAFSYIGRHIKESFTDCAHDKLWCAYLVGDNLLEATDLGQTYYARQHGFVESNPILGRHASELKLVSLTLILQGTKITSIHMLREGFTNKCRRDAENPDSMYMRIAESRGISSDPNRCTYGADLAAMTTWGYKAAVIDGNFNVLNYNPKTHCTEGKRFNGSACE